MLPKLSITEWNCKKQRPHFRNIATGVKEKGSKSGWSRILLRSWSKILHPGQSSTDGIRRILFIHLFGRPSGGNFEYPSSESAYDGQAQNFVPRPQLGLQ